MLFWYLCKKNTKKKKHKKCYCTKIHLRFLKKTSDLNSKLSKTLNEEINFFLGSFNLNITLHYGKINSGAIGGSIIQGDTRESDGFQKKSTR